MGDHRRRPRIQHADTHPSTQQQQAEEHNPRQQPATAGSGAAAAAVGGTEPGTRKATGHGRRWDSRGGGAGRGDASSGDNLGKRSERWSGTVVHVTKRLLVGSRTATACLSHRRSERRRDSAAGWRGSTSRCMQRTVSSHSVNGSSRRGRRSDGKGRARSC